MELHVKAWIDWRWPEDCSLPAGSFVTPSSQMIKGGADLTVPWEDTSGADSKVFAVQTNTRVITRCMLMTTDPGDLVFRPHLRLRHDGLYRRAVGPALDHVRHVPAWRSPSPSSALLTASFDYYELAHPDEGVGSGFTYKTVPHITLRSIANNPDIRAGMTRAEIDAAIARQAPQETLYDQPLLDRRKQRVSGPFSVEAVPAPTVAPLEQFLADDGQSPEEGELAADSSVARSGETLRQADWRGRAAEDGHSGQGRAIYPLCAAGAAGRLPLPARRRRDATERPGRRLHPRGGRRSHRAARRGVLWPGPRAAGAATGRGGVGGGTYPGPAAEGCRPSLPSSSIPRRPRTLTRPTGRA